MSKYSFSCFTEIDVETGGESSHQCIITNQSIDIAFMRKNKNVFFLYLYVVGAFFITPPDCSVARNENFDYLLEMHCTLYINPEGFINPEAKFVQTLQL